MSKVKIQGNASGTGVVTLTAPNTNTDRTITLPDGDISLGVGIDDNAASNAVTINSSQQVGVGTDNMQLYNAGAGGSTLVVTAESSSTNVLANTGSNITVSNGDGTADNTAALHFAREDTDGAPNYAGASVVAQFKETQVTGQYPKAELVFLTSTAANNAPSEKMRITSDGRGLSQFTAKAWVNFNGTGTVAINDSHNVSSITDSGVGYYYINFTNSLANANHATTATPRYLNGSGVALTSFWDNTGSTARTPLLVVAAVNAAWSPRDSALINAITFGD